MRAARSTAARCTARRSRAPRRMRASEGSSRRPRRLVDRRQGSCASTCARLCRALLEEVLDPDLDVQVAARSAVRTGFAVAARTNAHAFVDAGRDLDLERLVLLDAALAAAGRARLGNDLAAAVAVRAGLLDAEEALAHVHRAAAVAGGADLRARARLCAAALAGFAGLVRGDADLRFLAERRFLERDLHRVAQVAAATHLVPSAAAALAAGTAEDVAEDVAERLG